MLCRASCSIPPPPPADRKLVRILTRTGGGIPGHIVHHELSYNTSPTSVFVLLRKLPCFCTTRPPAAASLRGTELEWVELKLHINMSAQQALRRRSTSALYHSSIEFVSSYICYVTAVHTAHDHRTHPQGNKRLATFTAHTYIAYNLGQTCPHV